MNCQMYPLQEQFNSVCIRVCSCASVCVRVCPRVCVSACVRMCSRVSVFHQYKIVVHASLPCPEYRSHRSCSPRMELTYVVRAHACALACPCPRVSACVRVCPYVSVSNHRPSSLRVCDVQGHRYCKETCRRFNHRLLGNQQ